MKMSSNEGSGDIRRHNTRGTRGNANNNNSNINNPWVAAIVYDYLKTVGGDLAESFYQHLNPAKAPKKRRYVFPVLETLEENNNDVSDNSDSDVTPLPSTSSSRATNRKTIATKRTSHPPPSKPSKKAKVVPKRKTRSGKGGRLKEPADEDNSVAVPANELENKFKNLGGGHTLASSTSKSTELSVGLSSLAVSNQSGTSKNIGQVDVPIEKKNAAVARNDTKPEETEQQRLLNRQRQIIRDEALRQIAEQGLRSKQVPQKNAGEEEAVAAEELPTASDDPGVLFSCSYLGLMGLSRKEIEAKILEYILEYDELEQSACLMIHSCNEDSDKVAACVELLCKYLDNIISNPGEEKFQSIKINNKVFQEKASALIGVPQFLVAAGFVKSSEDGMFVFAKTKSLDYLERLRDLLNSTQPIPIEIERNVRVHFSSELNQSQTREELPSEFYKLTANEIKREQDFRRKVADRELTCRTKTQRENDKILQPKKYYRYASIRIAFPDGFILQGTFEAREKVKEIYQFVSANLSDKLAHVSFTLRMFAGQTLSNEDASIAEAQLTPSARVNFMPQDSAPSSSSSMDCGDNTLFLRPEALALWKN